MEIDELIAKYNEGLADPSEVKRIEELIEEGKVELTRLRELNALDEQVMKAEAPAPSLRLDDQFFSMLAAERKKSQRSSSFELPAWNVLFPRLSYGFAILLIGFFAGYLVERPGVNTEISQLNKEVAELKEITMLSLLEKESATERLRAVSLTSEMGKVSDNVTAALFETLNNDPNDNVRLAALEALTPYVRRSNVREGLVRAIARQDSPLVQLSLAELMVAIQEKRSVNEFQKLLDSENTPKDVKKQIRESIKVLI